MTDPTNTLPEPYQSVRLKPCPFGGGEPIEDWEREEREGDEVGPIISWSVYCTKCYAEVFSCQSREDAQEKWNRRVQE